MIDTSCVSNKYGRNILYGSIKTILCIECMGDILSVLGIELANDTFFNIRIELANNKIKLSIRNSMSFRNTESMLNMSILIF